MSDYLYKQRPKTEVKSFRSKRYNLRLNAKQIRKLMTEFPNHILHQHLVILGGRIYKTNPVLDLLMKHNKQLTLIEDDGSLLDAMVKDSTHEKHKELVITNQGLAKI